MCTQTIHQKNTINAQFSPFLALCLVSVHERTPVNIRPVSHLLKQEFVGVFLTDCVSAHALSKRVFSQW